MKITALWTKVRVGLWSGLFAALVLIAANLALRWVTGTGSLPELLSDRIAPMMGLWLFFHLIGWLKSYALLKQIGIVSMLGNELAAGLVFGWFFYWQQQVAPTRARRRLIGTVAVAFALLVAFLWGNLITNYLGLPPLSARLVSLVSLALCAVLFTAALLWSNRLLRAGEPVPSNSLAPAPARSPEKASAPAPAAKPAPTPSPLLEPMAHPGFTRRRAVLLGGGGSLLALFNLSALAHFYRISAYGYDGTVNAGPDLPLITPNNRFYSVTKNNVDPDPVRTAWALKIKGNVSRPRTLHYADLTGMPHTTQQATLQCISNPVGGNLSSNAVWSGVPLADLLRQAGPSPRARQVMLYAADGFVDAIPIEAALHPYTLVVDRMNGVELPVHHGYPVRLIVPGYVGEKSVKWLTAIEVREHPGEGFYEKQGWGPHFAIENDARFDVPSDGDEFPIHQPTVLHGEAFCGDRGVRAVQVSTDGGDSWETAELTNPGTHLTWAQWRYVWKPSDPGDITLSVRSIDSLGGIQLADSHGPGPGQSGGYQEIDVTVKA